MLMAYLYEDSLGHYHNAPNDSDEETYLRCVWLSPEPYKY